MKNYAEFINEYKENNVQALVLVHNINDRVCFRFVMLDSISADDFYAITNGGKDCFKAVKRNARYLANQMLVEEMSLEDFDKLEGSNRGYKAEMALFGKINTTDSLIDGVLHGFNVQVKCSINGSSTNKL